MRKIEFIGTSKLFGQQFHISPEKTVFINGDKELPAFFQIKERLTSSLVEQIKKVNAKTKFHNPKFVEDKTIIELVETAHADNCDFIRNGKKYKITIEEIK